MTDDELSHPLYSAGYLNGFKNGIAFARNQAAAQLEARADQLVTWSPSCRLAAGALRDQARAGNEPDTWNASRHRKDVSSRRDVRQSNGL